MPQVNVVYDDALYCHLDALAQKRGLSRSDFCRALLEEAVRADERGCALFSPSAAPIDEEALSALAHEMRETAMYLNRQLLSADRREKKLLEAFNATEEANREATARLQERLLERYREGVTPFAERLDEVRLEHKRLGKKILAVCENPTSLEAIQRDVAGVTAAIRRSRRVHNYHFFEKWRMRGWELGVLASFTFVVVLTTQILIASLLPADWFANRLVVRMYGSADVAICELYKSANGLDHCIVPQDRRAGDAG
ncbi:MAG: hypothetical protein AAGB23_02900 [Pseudomonadota bacterium]